MSSQERASTAVEARTQSDRLLRLSAVEATTGLKRSTIYRLINQGRFPQSIRITDRCAAWSEAAINAWVEERKAGVAR